MSNDCFRRFQPPCEVARTVFRNHYIRVVRTNGWIEVIIDSWPLEGRVFHSIEAARMAAIEHIRMLGRR